MRVIIAGSRGIENNQHIWDAVKASGFVITTVLSGHAPQGADVHGEVWAVSNNIPLELHPARWSAHRRAAGMIRNRKMAENADALIAVWDGKSPGTKDMIGVAQKHGLKIYIHKV